VNELKKGFSLLSSVLLLSIIFSFTFPTVSYGCSCLKPPKTEKAYEVAQKVFTGKVLKVSEDLKKNKIVSIQILESYKGVKTPTIEVKTANNSASCGFHFEVGKKYLVYTYGEQNETNICSRTNALNLAEEDLKILNSLSQTKQPIKTEATSNQLDVSIPFIIIIVFTIVLLFVLGLNRRKK